MNNDIIFVRTGKGEDEARSSRMSLSENFKRVLLMVDGNATIGEISRRAAPSLRSIIDEVITGLEKGGFIQDKTKFGNIPRMVLPTRVVAPPIIIADDLIGSLDFTSGYIASSVDTSEAEIAKLKMAADAKSSVEKALREEVEKALQKAAIEKTLREEAEKALQKAAMEKVRQEEAEKALQKAAMEKVRREEAEKALQKAAMEKVLREEAEKALQKAAIEKTLREEAEKALQKAAMEKARQEEAEKALQKAAMEKVLREEAEKALQKAVMEKAQQEEAEAARQEAENERARVHAEIEAAMAAAEARERAKADAMLHKPAQGVTNGKMPGEAAKLKSCIVATTRSTSATVLFFDVVGYTKQTVNKQNEIKNKFNKLVTDCLSVQEDGERIILDTGDGAAIGFLQHPEDALEVSMQFRKTVMANQHKDYPDLNVRIGIHLGPINVVKDMNGQNNMVGDGINDAQRVMSFAGIDQIYISRPYYDFISRLNDEYADLFQYRGIKKDKHEREHQVYELVDAKVPVAETISPQIDKLTTFAKLEPFNFAMHDVAVTPALEAAGEPEVQLNDTVLMGDFDQFNLPEALISPAALPSPTETPSPTASPSPAAPPTPPEKKPEVQPDKPVAKDIMPSAEDVKKFAEAQAKVWADAQRRSIEASRAGAEPAPLPLAKPHAAKEAPAARRKPITWVRIGSGLLVLLLISLFAGPYLLPMKGYTTSIEQLLALRLQQPVHVGYLAGRLLPTPRLELKDVSIGETKSIHVQQVQVDFALTTLFSSNKPVAGIELEGVLVNGAALPAVSAWLQTIAADSRYPVAHIGISHGKLEADGVQLSEISGELSFNQTGKFTQAKLHGEGNKLALEINATPENKMLISITARDSALPLLPNWVFEELNANGEITGESLVIAELNGHIKGGELLGGDARIDWRSGWHAQGAMTTKNIAMQSINNTLSGDLDVRARFQMQSESLSSLTETAVVEGVFAVKKGDIYGIDIVATARQNSMESLAGGRTHFEELSGDLYYANGDYRFRQIKMSAGVLNATGSLDIVKQQMSGRITADLTKFAGMGRVALQIGGMTDKPTLRTVR